MNRLQRLRDEPDFRSNRLPVGAILLSSHGGMVGLGRPGRQASMRYFATGRGRMRSLLAGLRETPSLGIPEARVRGIPGERLDQVERALAGVTRFYGTRRSDEPTAAKI